MRIYYYESGQEQFVSATAEGHGHIALDEYGRTWQEMLDGKWRTWGDPKNPNRSHGLSHGLSATRVSYDGRRIG